MTDRDLRERLIEAADDVMFEGLRAMKSRRRIATETVDAVLSALEEKFDGLHDEIQEASVRNARLRAEVERLSALSRLTEDPVWVGDAQHPDWADYVATNLLDALSLVPDTGDWHGALRSWCERTMTGRLKPNRQHGAIPPERVGEESDLRRVIAEHRTAIRNAGTVRVDSRDEPIAQAKQRADERLWAALEAALTPSQPPAGEVRPDSDNPSESERR